MRIAGIDPDTKAIQIVVIEQLDDGEPSIYRFQVAGRKAEDRIQALAAALEDAPASLWDDVQWVYIESPVLAQFKGKTNAKALRDQSQVVGIIRSYLWRRSIDHSLTDNTIWKKGLLGSGNASKEEIAAYAQKVLKVPNDQPQDAFDAACIAAWGFNNLP